jgi:hypothetical protein
MDDGLIEDAARIASEVKPIDDIRSSAEYRRRWSGFDEGLKGL